jgi:hypothetical protein
MPYLRPKAAVPIINLSRKYLDKLKNLIKGYFEECYKQKVDPDKINYNI